MLFNGNILKNINWNYTIEKTQDSWNYTLKLDMSIKHFQ